jgi:hypothetical protein
MTLRAAASTASQGVPGRAAASAAPPYSGRVYSAAQPAGTANLQIATKTMPLSEIEEAWKAPNKPRVVITIQ